MRICSVCKKQIVSNHKWHTPDFKIQHRVCDEPVKYYPTGTSRQRIRELRALEREKNGSLHTTASEEE